MHSLRRFVPLAFLFLPLGAWAAAPEVLAAREEPAASSAEAAGMRLEVDLSERVLRVYQGEEVTGSYPVAVGQRKHPTPRGEFRIRHIIWNPRWVPPKEEWAAKRKPRGPGDPKNPMGRVKMFFQEPDYYIHGTNDEESLGTAASHGCLRMANSDIVELAREVMENGGARKSDGWFRRVMNRIRSTQSVWLSRGVPLTVKS